MYIKCIYGTFTFGSLDQLNLVFHGHRSKGHFSMCCQNNDGGGKWPILTGCLKICFFNFVWETRSWKIVLLYVSLSPGAKLFNRRYTFVGSYNTKDKLAVFLLSVRNKSIFFICCNWKSIDLTKDAASCFDCVDYSVECFK